MLKRSMCLAVCATALSFSRTAAANDDQALVARLDTECQAAVKANDAATMDRLLADDFILVLGEGTVYNKADLLKDARNKTIIYEHQDDTRQTVRVWGDTVTLTVLRRLKAKKAGTGKSYDAELWFTDVYVRTPTGWRYSFGQASLPLPQGH